MKIGILTFHYAHNYGAVLQAYGLQEYLKSLGHETYIIDHRNPFIASTIRRNNHRDWLSSNPKACLIRLWQFIANTKIRHERYDNFEHFINQHLSLIANTESDMQDLDVVVIGSDQVWSSPHTGGQLDPMYLGCNIKTKLISYAASCSRRKLSDTDIRDFKTHLPNFQNISVRESGFKALLSKLTDKDIDVVVDPTVLAGVDVYDRISKEPDRKKYILIYEIQRHKSTLEFAKRLASEHDAEIIELTNGVYGTHGHWMHEGASPEEFLGYFKHALAVVTTSFHGTVFSILFKKPFYTLYQHSPSDDRMVNLLKQLELDDRMVEASDNATLSCPDYQGVNDRLDYVRANSKNYLAKSLN
ncbi:MAG: polysaccharide pyruvyl transferase family protein [Muribaculaceae bacterium]|nr:polysaccharide pyruvyl transferase family protein [Muribaculaceae bacterium]